jgi:hypothetical protein
MKRTWITVKRGILEPKHRFALGELIWLFIYILDLTNWEAGVIEEWLDRGAAEEMEMPIATLRDQRMKLEKLGYITSERKQHGIRILVHNWTNPREYTGKKYNEKLPVNTLDTTPSHTPVNTLDIKSQPIDNVPSYNQKSQITNQNMIPAKNAGIESREPCDIDGIPDSWKKEPKKKLVNPDQYRLADTIAALLHIKPPVCKTRKDFAAAQVTWWKPVTEMLRQAENVEEAERVADNAIKTAISKRYTPASPKSLYGWFMSELALQRQTNTSELAAAIERGKAI